MAIDASGKLFAFHRPSRRSSSWIAPEDPQDVGREAVRVAARHPHRSLRQLWITDGQARTASASRCSIQPGRLLMTLGTKGVRGEGPTPWRPCDVAVAATATSSSPTDSIARQVRRQVLKAWGKRGDSRASSTCRTPSSSTRAAACWSAIDRTTASRSSIRTAFHRPVDAVRHAERDVHHADDTLYVVDYNVKKGVFVGSARTAR